MMIITTLIRCSPSVSSLKSVYFENSLIGEAATNLLHWLLRYGKHFRLHHHHHADQVRAHHGVVGLVLLLSRLDPLPPLKHPQHPQHQLEQAFRAADRWSWWWHWGWLTTSRSLIETPEIDEDNLRSSFFPDVSCRVGLVKQCAGKFNANTAFITITATMTMTIDHLHHRHLHHDQGNDHPYRRWNCRRQLSVAAERSAG